MLAYWFSSLLTFPGGLVVQSELHLQDQFVGPLDMCSRHCTNYPQVLNDLA